MCVYKWLRSCVSGWEVLVVLSISAAVPPAVTAPPPAFCSSGSVTCSFQQQQTETTLLTHTFDFSSQTDEFSMCSLNCASCACVLLHFSLKHLGTIKCCDCASHRNHVHATFFLYTETKHLGSWWPVWAEPSQGSVKLSASPIIAVLTHLCLYLLMKTSAGATAQPAHVEETTDVFALHILQRYLGRFSFFCCSSSCCWQQSHSSKLIPVASQLG